MKKNNKQTKKQHDLMVLFGFGFFSNLANWKVSKISAEHGQQTYLTRLGDKLRTAK